MDDTTLVTGGTGMLGRALARAVVDDPDLNNAVHRWVFAGSRDADLTCQRATRALFDAVRPTRVVHLAARVGGLFANQADNAGFLRDNARMALNVADACRDAGVRRCVMCLSTCVFPADQETLEDMHAGPPHASNEGYAYAKRLAEVVCRLYTAQGPTRFVAVVPTNLYGPHDNFATGAAHVLPALMRKCLEASLAGETSVPAPGTGSARRQFLHARDAALMLLRVLRSETTDTVMLVAPDSEVTIREAAQIVAAVSGVRIDFDNDPGKDGAARKAATPDPMFHDMRFTPLAAGLAQVYAWLSQAHAAGTARE